MWTIARSHFGLSATLSLWARLNAIVDDCNLPFCLSDCGRFHTRLVVVPLQSRRFPRSHFILKCGRFHAPGVLSDRVHFHALFDYVRNTHLLVLVFTLLPIYKSSLEVWLSETMEDVAETTEDGGVGPALQAGFVEVQKSS